METGTIGDRANAARWMNVVLGLWLFVSAFLWPHQRHIQSDTWLVGMVITTTAGLALAMPGARRVTSILAVWLLVSTIVLAHGDTPTLLNNALVAVVMFGLSLVRPRSLGMGRQPHDVGPVFG